jgi:hypothetical protein
LSPILPRPNRRDDTRRREGGPDAGLVLNFFPLPLFFAGGKLKTSSKKTAPSNAIRKFGFFKKTFYLAPIKLIKL